MDDKRSLAELRQQVRQVDDRLYALVAERLQLARRIGEVKQASDLPIKDYKVEKEVIDRSRAKARELGLYEELAEETARLLIRYAVMAQDETRERARATLTSQAQKILVAGGRGRMGAWLSEFFESFGHAVSHYDPEAPPTPSPYPLVPDLEAAAAAHDVVVIAAPISAAPALIERLARGQSKALVFDICSLKTPLVAAIRAAAQAGLQISSVHPMFGPQVAVLAGRNIIICDTGKPELTARTRQLFEGTTASLIEVPLERHDRLMSYVLGLSHLTNLVFTQVLATSGEPFKEFSSVSSTTFNSQLDVAQAVIAENPDLYYEIQAENRFTPELVQALAKALAAYGDAIKARDRDAFKALMAAGRGYLG